MGATLSHSLRHSRCAPLVTLSVNIACQHETAAFDSKSRTWLLCFQATLTVRQTDEQLWSIASRFEHVYACKYAYKNDNGVVQSVVLSHVVCLLQRSSLVDASRYVQEMVIWELVVTQGD